ncbi:sure-like protein [Amniculicola lignicola CBS 123094]|uniref:Sure-like protein n=1 Tax=Amniculicola lignicola CBS 123094 TaxID=1392246 RepID=A0A6A5W975_9PLEO|nr:sure-like protein [Amniculicola lignicola CBS 123094]
MKFSIATATVLAVSANAAKILMNNDDGFGSGNIREFYRLLKEAGHDVIMVAPAFQQSAQGGRSDFTTFPNLTTPSQYNIVPAGSPSVGTDPNDSNIWYYNGTPAACNFVALDYVLPRYYEDWTPDLLVSGPNFGVDTGPFVFTLSGTLGATYSAVERSIPAIAFSGSNPSIAYQNVTNTSNPATWVASVSAKITQQFIDATPKGQTILPIGYGVNVNIPDLDGPDLPPVVATRINGDADVDVAIYNETTGLFKYGEINPKAAGANVCFNGDCSLPGETLVVAGGSVSISVFTVDYDAPRIPLTEVVFGRFEELTKARNATAAYKRRAARRGPMLKGRDVRK